MKGKKFKAAILLLSILIVLAGCGNRTSKNNTHSNSPGSVKIQYNLNHISKLASNQMAVWIEDSDGNYVKSIYATKFIAEGGYKDRPQAIPEWVKKSNWKNASKSEVDSVSGATMKPGRIDVTWDCTDKNNKAVKPGKYFYFVEGNIYWENRVIWKGEIEVGSSGSKSEAKAAYIPQNAENQGKLIENVSAVFTPK